MATTPLNFLTPSGVVQCRATRLLWSGGSAPYSVTAIVAQSSLNSPTLGVVGSFTTLRAAYRVTIPGGTLIKFRVVDSSTPPQVADTNLISVGESEVDSCLPASQQTRTRSSIVPSSTPAASTPAPISPTTSTPTPTRDSTTLPGASVSSPRNVASRSSGIGSLGVSSMSDATDDVPLGSSTNLANLNERRHTSISPAFFGAAAGVAILLILVVAGWCMWNKRRRRNTQAAEEDWFAVPHHQHHADVKAQDDIAMNTIGAQHQQRWTGIAHASTEQLMPGSRAVSMYPGHQPFAVSQEHDADRASLYAARAQEYYPADTKHSINVMSAPDADDSHGEASVLPYATGATLPAAPYTGGQPTVAEAREKPLPVPANLSPEEMSRLADLVASRMRENSDPQEPPPSYQ